MTKAATRATAKYRGKTYDSINIIMRKDSGLKALIHAAAKASGNSLNGYIVDAIKDKIGLS